MGEKTRMVATCADPLAADFFDREIRFGFMYLPVARYVEIAFHRLEKWGENADGT